jgi:glycerol uptake facilitator-like aquaporin
MASMGKLSKDDLLPYILSQIAGGMVAVEVSKRFKV